MISTIIAFIIGKAWVIIGGLGVVILAVFKFFSWKSQRLQRENEELRQTERVYQAKDKAHKQDIASDAEVDMRINALRDKVDNESPQKGAADIESAINDYFSGKGK